jgi:anti-sigma regulatory factor (Ser/Thr protein kinase)
MTTTNPERSLSFVLKNDLTEIATIGDTLERFCSRNGIGSDVCSVVNLALEEVVANIITCGYRDGGDHRIWIDLAVDGTAMTARVQDDAAPFDPVAKDEPTLDRPEGPTAGALGIHLVQTLMDGVEYSREQGRNVLVIRKSTGS